MELIPPRRIRLPGFDITYRELPEERGPYVWKFFKWEQVPLVHLNCPALKLMVIRPRVTEGIGSLLFCIITVSLLCKDAMAMLVITPETDSTLDLKQSSTPLELNC